MLADQSRVQDVAGEEGQQRRAAASGFLISRRGRGQALEPDLPLVRQLRGQPVGAQQRMRQTPGPPGKLRQRLRQPASQRRVIKVAKGRGIFFPKAVER